MKPQFKKALGILEKAEIYINSFYNYCVNLNKKKKLKNYLKIKKLYK